MSRKPATHRHVSRSHSHTFTFLPNEHLTKPDWEKLRVYLEAQRGSAIFHGMKAWRLRLDRRSRDALKTPWALALPLGSFSSFSEDLCTPESDLEGRQACVDRIRANRTAATTDKRPGPVGLGFNLTQDVFTREGVTYYREAAIEAFRDVAPHPRLWWAFFHFIREARKHPHIITGKVPDEDGKVARLRPFVPLNQRKKIGNRRVRGPAWTKGEDTLIKLFFEDGKCLTVPHFEAQERENMKKGLPPRDRAATIKRWEEHIIGDLKHKRTLSSIKQRINSLNNQTRLKYERNGKVPKMHQAAFDKEYLGVRGRGAYKKSVCKSGWLLIGQAGTGGPYFIDHTKAVMLRSATVGKALPTSFKVVAFVKQTPRAVDELLATLVDYHQLHDWYLPSDEVIKAVDDAQMQTIDKLKAADRAYITEARRLGSWLSWDLLKHLPDASSS